MAAPSSGPFREESLARLSSPERLDQLLQLVPRRSWLPLATLAALVAILLVWAVVGRVPVYVEGRGVLVRPRDFVELHAPGPGYVAVLHVGVGDRVAAGDELVRIARPELDKQLELQREKTQELERQARAMLRLQRASLDDAAAAVPQAVDDLAAARELARRLRERELQAIAREREALERQWQLARTFPEALERRLAAQRQLFDENIISSAALVEAEQAYVESLNRVTVLEGQLRDLHTRELQIEEQTLDRLQRIAEREREIADARRETARLEALRDKETRIVSDHAGRILELNVKSGEFVDEGDRVGSMELSGDGARLACLSYFTVRDGKRLEPGMPMLVSPDTVERERFGSIRAAIAEISAFPVSLAEVKAAVGSPDLAQTLSAGGYLMQVRAELEGDAATPSGLLWSSAGGPPVQFSSGTTTTTRVAIEQRRPISFVLPFLRATAGID